MPVACPNWATPAKELHWHPLWPWRFSWSQGMQGSVLGQSEVGTSPLLEEDIAKVSNMFNYLLTPSVHLQKWVNYILLYLRPPSVSPVIIYIHIYQYIANFIFCDNYQESMKFTRPPPLGLLMEFFVIIFIWDVDLIVDGILLSESKKI